MGTDWQSTEPNADQMLPWLGEVIAELQRSGGLAEKNLAQILAVYEFAFRTGKDMPGMESTVQALGIAVAHPEYLVDQQRFVDEHMDRDFYLGLPPEASEWALRFLEQILAELRKAICTKDAQYSKLKAEYKSYPKAFAVAVATSALATAGISGPMSLGIATFILLVLVTATKNAFCKMTDTEALAAVRQAAATKRVKVRRAV